MAKLVTRAQMRALEEAAIAAGSSERELMAQAGIAAAQEAWMGLGMMEGRIAVVLVGPGKNGGDGLVAALHLHEWGAATHVYLLEPRPADDPEWQAVVEAGIATTLVEEDADYAVLEQLLTDATLAIDALFGTGLRPAERPITGHADEILWRLRAAHEANAPIQIIALDIPSGVDADSGFADPATVAADITLTFGAPKLGLFQAPGRVFAGRVDTVDIGIPAAAMADLGYEELRLRDLRTVNPKRPADGNKGTFGHAWVVAGSKRFPGAARLAAEAAARTGCGLVTIAAAESIQHLLVSLPDPTHEPLPDLGGDLHGESARSLLRALQSTKGPLLVGPGLGFNDNTREFVQHLIAGLDSIEGLTGIALDADALNVLADEAGWHERFSAPRILTPHPGEMARLLGTTVEDVQSRRVAVASEYAARTNSVVVLKGAGTIVAAPDGRARLSDVANSALSHGGTGDVLAGIIAGMLAQGMSPYDAASAGVFMLGECGRRAAEAHGEAGSLASDLLRVLPEVRKSLETPVASGMPFGGMGGPPMGGGGLGPMGGMGGLGGGLGGLGGGMGDMGGGFGGGFGGGAFGAGGAGFP